MYVQNEPTPCIAVAVVGVTVRQMRIATDIYRENTTTNGFTFSMLAETEEDIVKCFRILIC